MWVLDSECSWAHEATVKYENAKHGIEDAQGNAGRMLSCDCSSMRLANPIDVAMLEGGHSMSGTGLKTASHSKHTRSIDPFEPALKGTE